MADVRLVGGWRPVYIIGADAQGRTLVQCPNLSCGEHATVEPDGRIVCPSCSPLAEAIAELLSDAYERLGGRDG